MAFTDYVNPAGSKPWDGRGFGTTTDTSSVDGLLYLAQQQGGALADAANELVHPRTSILSTMSDGFKNAFKGFVDTLSIPSNIVAGAISDDYTVGEAIDQHLRPSDVIFNDLPENASVMQKTGSFFVRTATDIVLDPLTYVTFGQGAGLLGLRALPKVQLAEKAAEKMGVAAFSARALSDEGADVYKFLKNVEYQAKGLTVAKNIEAKSEIYTLAKNELDDLLKATIDAPLNQDFAKKAMTAMLEKFPHMSETVLDSGGIKFFGKSILSGQRISSALAMVPGMTVMDQATLPVRNFFSAPFDPTMVKVNGSWTRLPEEYVNLETAAKDLSTGLKDLKTKNLVDIVRGNKLTVEEAKMLTAAIESRKMPADARLANAYKQFLGFTEDQYQMLVKSGIAVSHRDNHVPHILLKEDMPAELPTGMMFPPKQKAEASFARKMGETVAEAKANGFTFDENIVTAHLQRTFDNVDSAVSSQFMRSLASSMGAPASQAPAGWRKVAVSGVTKEGEKILNILNREGEEMVFHPAVAARVEKFVGSVINDDASKDVLAAFDKVQNLWKASVTSVFPAFHGRNAISNVFMNFMDLGHHSINPVNHAMSAQLITLDRQANSLATKAAGVGPAADAAREELSEMLGRTVFDDAAGYNWTFGELRQVMKMNGVAFTKSTVGPLDIAVSRDETLSALFPEYLKGASKAKNIAKKSLPVSQQFVPFEVGREVGRAVEEQARILNFVANLRNTGDAMLAANRTKQFLFDYQNLTNFEKQYLRRLIPFYTFTRKNLEQQVKGLMTTPGRTEAQLTALTNLGDVISGGELTDEEREALPDWIKAGIGILRKKDGPIVEIYGSFGSPIEAVFQQFQPNTLLGSVSPILRLPVEQASGYSFYQGKMLSDVTNATAFKRAPKPIQDFIGYTEINGQRSDGSPFTMYISLRPERMNLLLNLPPTSRVLGALKQMEAQDVSTGSKTLQQLIGLRPYSFDLEQEAEKREREMRIKLEKLLDDANVVATYKRVYIPKKDKDFGDLGDL